MGSAAQQPSGPAGWSWPEVQDRFEALAARPLSAATVGEFLAEWTRLAEWVWESFARLRVATTVDTADADAERRHHAFLDEVYPKAQQADQQLKEKLLASGLEPPGFEVPLRKMRTQAELYREANLPLLSEERKLAAEHDKRVGAQTVVWDGQEVALPKLRAAYRDPDRARREAAWRLEMERWLEDREALNDLWRRLLALRRRQAANADAPDYRAFRWRQLLRFDYTPEDCAAFHDAIEQVVVPAATRITERRRRRLGLRALRPWDLNVDPLGRPALRPFSTAAELADTTLGIFRRVDPRLGRYFGIMVDEGLLDLESRKNKAPGGYCTSFPVARRPFIFMNAVGLHDDVQTLLHEGGHAFHVFETSGLPYVQQRTVGSEMAEVASMAMELLAAPYLAAREGGFYRDADAARAQVEHLEGLILFWPYMAVVDAFQHWAYTDPDAAADPANCDARWAALWRRFLPGVDWSGLETELATGWHRKHHIHTAPFYYVEYGLAQLGAVQIWANALEDQAGAVAAYLRGLALGGTRPLPELYAAAGARFALDAATLGTAVDLIEATIARLDPD